MLINGWNLYARVQLLGIWFLVQWTNIGKPSRIQLAELGPGRGTLMMDMLRVCTGKYRTPESPNLFHAISTMVILNMAPFSSTLTMESRQHPDSKSSETPLQEYI